MFALSIKKPIYDVAWIAFYLLIKEIELEQLSSLQGKEEKKMGKGERLWD